MPLTTYNITGSLKDENGNPLTRGTVTFAPYATHDARVDGANALLGSIRRDIATLPSPLSITAGDWTVTIETKAKVEGRPAFKAITTSLNINADISWGQIVAGAVTNVSVTPTHVQQAADSAAAADASADSAAASAASVQREQPNGVAGLDAAGKLLEVRIPDRLSDANLVTKDELIFSAADYGAVGDGVTDDTAAIQATINAASATGQGARVLLGAGTYKIPGGLTLTAQGISFEGRGPSITVLESNVADALTLGGPSSHLTRARICNMRVRSMTGGGHVINIPYGFNQCILDNLWLQQTNNGKSVLNCVRVDPVGGIFDVTFSNGYYVQPAAATVPAFNVVGPANHFSANKFDRCRVESGGTYFFYIEVTGAGSYNYGNVWDTVNFEMCNNGGVYLKSGLGNTFINPQFHDNGTINSSLIRLGKSALGAHTRGTTIIGYQRASGSLGAGAYDIHEITGEVVATTVVGITAPTSAGVTVSLGSTAGSWGRTTVVGYDPVAVTLVNTSATESTLLSSNGILAGSLILGGGSAITKHMKASTVLDFPSIAAGSSASLTVTVPGAAVGDDATAHPNGTGGAPVGVMYQAIVTGTDTVTVRATNLTSAAIDPGSATWRVRVWR